MRKNRQLSQLQLAERLGVTRAACSHWEKEEARPSIDHLVKLASLLAVSFEWLATGRGEMEQNPDRITGSVNDYLAFIPDLDSQQQELLKIYSRLAMPQRSRLLEFLRTL